MQVAIAGAACGRPYTQFSYKLSGTDVMSWKPKSRLQQLWEGLIEVVTQAGNP